MVAIAVEKSHNAKTGMVSATYVTQASCPVCSFKASGCYAESGHVAFVTRRLNKVWVNESPEIIAESEATEIRKLTGKLPLRVHVVGDCITNESARIVSSAMLEHTSKHNQPSWTYTHAWRDVDRASWQGASVQASCESAKDVLDANARGYATTLVVTEHPSDKLYTTPDGAKVIPCPEQTRGTNCAECRLCMGPALERRRQLGISIGFAVHGASKAKAARKLG